MVGLAPRCARTPRLLTSSRGWKREDPSGPGKKIRASRVHALLHDVRLAPEIDRFLAYLLVGLITGQCSAGCEPGSRADPASCSKDTSSSRSEDPRRIHSPRRHHGAGAPVDDPGPEDVAGQQPRPDTIDPDCTTSRRWRPVPGHHGTAAGPYSRDYSKDLRCTSRNHCSHHRRSHRHRNNRRGLRCRTHSRTGHGTPSRIAGRDNSSQCWPQPPRPRKQKLHVSYRLHPFSLMGF